jgi:23S rRNA pseudouridine2605 synthase
MKQPRATERDSDDELEEFPTTAPAAAERLQKILASAGIASRRRAEEYILNGRVQVNGQIVTELGTKADPHRDHIRVDGKRIHVEESLRYFMLNKPKGHITTASDPQGRPTVMEFFSRVRVRMFPVGRLDYLSEGLLLVTNDGELANALMRASSHIPKTYLVKVSGIPTEAALASLRRGISIPLGAPGANAGRVRTGPAQVRLFREGENPWYEITITEGRNRQLRKMFEEIGHHVEKIRRVEYGPLVLDVKPGEQRELTPLEVQALYRAVKLKPKSDVPAPRPTSPRHARSMAKRARPVAGSGTPPASRA